MSTKLFSGFTSTLSKFLNKDYSGIINQETLDNLNEQSSVEELNILDEIKTPYKVSTKNLFEVTYGRVDKNISRLKSKKNKYKVQIQYNYEQYKEYLGYNKFIKTGISDGINNSNILTSRATTLRDAITIRNRIRKTLPGRITIHSNGVRKIENTYKNTVKMSNATVSKDLPIGVTFSNELVVNKTDKFSLFKAWYKTPEGKYINKSFGKKGVYEIDSIDMSRAKQLAIAVRKEYEYHLVNSIPYYIDSIRFKGWQKLSEFEFRQLIDIRMKKLV